MYFLDVFNLGGYLGHFARALIFITVVMNSPLR